MTEYKKLKFGDKVLVNNNAFDEQIERMEDTTTIYTVSEVKDVSLTGTSGQWAKVKNGIRLVDNQTGDIRTYDEWIDRAWLKTL